MNTIDLRSDTLTLPTREMLESILTAPLGDEKRGRGDPTVRKLEELAAQKVGKEAALLVPSGTMGNAVSILAHTKRGDQVILESHSHTYTMEHGSWTHFGLMPVTINGKLGYIEPSDLADAIRKEDPKTGLIETENTFNDWGGSVLTSEQMKSTWEVAKNNNLPVHLDGARIFNAAVYLGIDAKELTKYADSVMFCLSKGLSAPVGSMVCGTKEFIERARFQRNLLGGGMRQAGIIAAPGIIAITKMIDRLKEDHENAAMLAEALREIKGIKIPYPVQTNMVFFDMGGLGITPEQFTNEMGKYNIKCSPRKGSTFRFVTYRGIDKEQIKYVIECLNKITNK